MRKILAIGLMGATLGMSLATVAQAQDMTPAVKSGPPSVDWPIQDLLADPITLAVMAADLVDPAALKAMLAGLAGRLQLARPAKPGRCCAARDDRPW